MINKRLCYGTHRAYWLVPGQRRLMWSRVASACGGLKQGFSSRPVIEFGLGWWEQRILATRPVVSDKALALQLCRKEFPPKTESSETSKVFIKRKKEYVWIDTQVDSERESRPHSSLNHFYGAFLPCFLWPIILICLVLSPYLLYLRIFPCVSMRLLAKMDSTKEAYG